MDLTQKGNWENLRNETFDGEKFVYTSSWKIPHRGIFEFDYASTVRPESEAEPMEEDLFEEVRHCEERSAELRLRYFATARSEATSIKNTMN